MITFKEYLLLEELNKSLHDKLAAKIKIPDENHCYEINFNDTNIAFNILNKEVFKSRLSKQHIIVKDANRNLFKDNKVYIGRHTILINGAELANSLLSNNSDISNFKSNYTITLVNGFKISFMDFIDILLHEMIHQYDYQYGEGKIGFLLNILKDNFGLKIDSYDEHGDWFQNKVKDINRKFGTNISINFDIMKNKERNLIESIEKILEDVNESDTFIISKDCKNIDIINCAKRMRRCMVDDGTNIIEVLADGSISITGFN